MSIQIGLDPASDRLLVTLRNAQGKDHTIRLRFDADLFIHLHTILSNHQDGEAPLNTPGSPTQALVNAWLAKGGRVEDEGARAEARLRARYGEEGASILGEIKLDI